MSDLNQALLRFFENGLSLNDGMPSVFSFTLPGGASGSDEGISAEGANRLPSVGRRLLRRPLDGRVGGSDNGVGRVFQGGVPLPQWIQNEQQRGLVDPPRSGVPANSAARTPKAAATSAVQEAERLRLKGNTSMNAGCFKEAVELYTLSIAKNPLCAFSYWNRSLAHLKLGNVVEAVADAEEGVNLDPNSHKGYYRLGMALMARGDFRRALDSLRRSVALSSDEEKESIQVAVSKCQSKILRGTCTRLLSETSEINSDTGSNSRIDGSEDFPLYGDDAPLDFNNLLTLAKKAVETRSKVGAYQNMHSVQDSFTECPTRFKRMEELLKISLSTPIHDLITAANEKQAALRKMLKSEDRHEFSDLKKGRDECLKKAWEEAEKVQSAIQELRQIAMQGNTFLSTIQNISGSRVEEVEADEGTPSDEEKISRSSDLGPSFSVHAMLEKLNELLNRRTEIEEEVHKLQQRLAVTEEAGRAFFSALLNEERLVEKLSPLFSEAAELNKGLEHFSKGIVKGMMEELSEDRLERLETIEKEIHSVKNSQNNFNQSLEEGNVLLEREAGLERDRLRLERERIKTQGEIEWLKVCEEPLNKVNQLEKSLRHIIKRLEDVQEAQKEIQSQILEMIQGDHPELAWTSMLSGSRILKLVKGSGLWLNATLSDAQILETISTNDNIKVYRSIFRGEMVTLKEIPIENNERCKDRFSKEVSLVSCKHPSVIQIKGVFFDSGNAYVILPYFSRGSLQNMIEKKESISWMEIQDMFRQLISGIAFLHERGIIHGNINPSTIFLSDGNRPVLTDFGVTNPSIASDGLKEQSALSDSSSPGVESATKVGEVSREELSKLWGSTPWAAPELLDGSHQPSCASDVWALGSTLYAVAAQNAYFFDSSLGAPEGLSPLLPSQERIEVPARRVSDERLADLISSTLMREPNRRPNAFSLLAHPYFSVSLNPHSFNRFSALQTSDSRIEAVHSFIHAVQKDRRTVFVSVQRSQMVESVASIFSDMSEEGMLSSITVIFQGEDGIDQGALTTEMLNLYYEQLVVQHHALVHEGMDSEASDELSLHSENVLLTGVTYVPAQDKRDIDASVYELLGKMMVKSIVENRPLPIQLNASVLKYFCDATVSIQDFEEFDGTKARHLNQLRFLSDDDLAATMLDFSSFSEDFLKNQCHDRYQQDTVVQPSNVNEYVQLFVEYTLIHSRRRALEAMKKGFFSFPSLSSHLKLLPPFDLQILLSGLHHIDADVIISALEFKGFPSNSKTPAFLKATLAKMSQNNLRRFLQLCTSNATIPVSGTMKKIKVECCADVKRLPVGHGCVHQLDFPDYNNLKQVEDKLFIALAHVSDGFHIV